MTTPNESVLHMLEKHEHEIVTAAPVWHEPQYDCRRLPRSRKRKIIESFLNDVVRQNIPLVRLFFIFLRTQNKMGSICIKTS